MERLTMLVGDPNRAGGFQDSRGPSARADGPLCIASPPAALSGLPSDTGTARREHRMRDRIDSGAQKRRLEACVAAYLRRLRTVRAW
jgi:hypothetical protein